MRNKKKILVNTLGKGNMTTLVEFYKKNPNTSYKVIYKEYAKYKKYGFKHIYNRLLDYTGRYDLVLSDYPTKLYSRAKKGIFVNHGYGTKATPGKEEFNNPKVMSVYDSMRENLDYIVTMGKRDENYYLKYDSNYTKRYPEYVPLGLPRIDCLFDSKEVEKQTTKIKAKYKIEGKKILLYSPTWRNYDIKEYTSNLYQELGALNEYLKETDWIMIYRPHYISGIFEEQKLKEYDNILVITSETEPDVQPFLMASDVLMTDYSSIYLDFLVLNRPIIFLGFDYSYYAENRGLEIDYANYIETPGIKVSTFEETQKYLEELKEKDDYQSRREEAQQLFYEYLDGQSSQRIWNLIDEILK
ncbi:CDP-glycerol glycerophosphotransferase family protein [Carnobacterium sp. FSL E2-0243]|uniref:CDP-glycerol glycerophosphotransferase family protein n=1 Tax=Carnobacterium sp. FSL E2-0243 TaxID=2921365 RepID=UPI0030F9062A